MINITQNELCCGCSACFSRCPQKCISMQVDSEGFLYPVVEKNICIDCGLCEKVCHEIYPYEERRPLRVIAANNKNTKIRLESSSGGIFSILAESVIRDGGVVFGACFDENWQVKIDYTETIEDIARFRGSKYVQARTDSSYLDCEKFLKDGRKVLYSGSPCQITGLKHFLHKDYSNLILVDFVCHGTPSPKVWGRYLDESIENISKELKAIRFRDKQAKGWKDFRLALDITEKGEEKTLSVSNWENQYMSAFLSNLILRPSCYSCMAKSGRSCSDITLADYWGIQKIHPEIDDNKGTSLVMINTEKGFEVLDMERIIFVDSTFENAIASNRSIRDSVIPHPNRTKFFAKLDEKKDVQKWIDTSLKISLKQRIVAKIVICKGLVMRLLGNGG